MRRLRRGHRGGSGDARNGCWNHRRRPADGPRADSGGDQAAEGRVRHGIPLAHVHQHPVPTRVGRRVRRGRTRRDPLSLPRPRSGAVPRDHHSMLGCGNIHRSRASMRAGQGVRTVRITRDASRLQYLVPQSERVGDHRWQHRQHGVAGIQPLYRDHRRCRRFRRTGLGTA